MKKIMLKFFILSNFFVLALLTSSAANLILELIRHYHVTMSSAGYIVALRYIAAIIVGFFLSGYVKKNGYKRSLLLGCFINILLCLFMKFHPGYFSATVFFFFLGISYGFIKSSLYSIIKIITENKKEHTSFISIMESVYMFGFLGGFWVFSYFVRIDSWTNVYLLFSMICFVMFVICLFIDIPELEERDLQNIEKKNMSFKITLSLMSQGVVWFSLITLLMYVLIEKGLATWLPIYNHCVFSLSASMSIEVASIFGAAIAVGRLVFGVLLKYTGWYLVLIFSICLAVILLLTSISFSSNIGNIGTSMMVYNWHGTHYYVFILPLIGFFLGPVFPIISSSILAIHSKEEQCSITGLIIIFSSLGGIMGSISLGYVIGHLGGAGAMEFLVYPLIILIFSIIVYSYLHKRISIRMEQLV